MNDLKERLKGKGWTDDDVYNAISIIESGKSRRPKKIAFLDSIIYWVVLVAAMAGNFIISIILIPFMLAMSGFRLWLIIFVIGIAFGAFFDLLIRDIEKIEKRDIIIAGIFLPLLALINVGFMVRFANFLQKALVLNNIQHSAIMISIIYVFAFVLPYLIKSLMLYKEGRKDIIHKL